MVQTRDILFVHGYESVLYLCINNMWVSIDSFTARKSDHLEWLSTIRKQSLKPVLSAMRAVGQGQT